MSNFIQIGGKTYEIIEDHDDAGGCEEVGCSISGCNYNNICKNVCIARQIMKLSDDYSSDVCYHLKIVENDK